MAYLVDSHLPFAPVTALAAHSRGALRRNCRCFGVRIKLDRTAVTATAIVVAVTWEAGFLVGLGGGVVVGLLGFVVGVGVAFVGLRFVKS